jgi:GAF domain-containing protein
VEGGGAWAAPAIGRELARSCTQTKRQALCSQVTSEPGDHHPVNAIPPPDGLVAAVSAAVVDWRREQDTLIQSIVEVARAIFNAAASSIFLLDESTNELVFEAVAGEGASILPGRRFPATRGIAGWVLTSHEPIMVSDVSTNNSFARDVAESTGYVPQSLMAAPLLSDDKALGVLEVLDYDRNPSSVLEAMDLLQLFARQAAVGLRIVQRSRAARRILEREGGEFEELVSVAHTLNALDDDQRAAGLQLLGSVRALLTSNFQ